MATGSAEKVKMVRQLALGEWLRGECLPGLTLHRPFEAQGKQECLCYWIAQRTCGTGRCCESS